MMFTLPTLSFIAESAPYNIESLNSETVSMSGYKSNSDIKTVVRNIMPILYEEFKDIKGYPDWLVLDIYQDKFEMLGPFTQDVILDDDDVYGPVTTYSDDVTMSAQFTNNTDIIQDWRPTTSYQSSTSTSMTLGSHWLSNTQASMSVETSVSAKVFGIGTEAKYKTELSTSFQKGGSRSYTEQRNITHYVGNSGLYKVRPGQTCVVQDTYGKAYLKNSTSGDYLLFGDVRFRLDKEKPYTFINRYKLWEGENANITEMFTWFYSAWGSKGEDLYNKRKITRSEKASGDRIYAAVSDIIAFSRDGVTDPPQQFWTLR
ncbi:hypothetical protein [Vibrio coralliilyticus]|uniref:hypothetical protein n=1 Tax=Vibrio coralliilyticus TaxID=190893 RepID=UPI001E289B67|nr:hypothetical protein [Vibrio coralliilyticus]MCC2525773.1 hypothetical protein [Vibrio coralliilyticus]